MVTLIEFSRDTVAASADVNSNFTALNNALEGAISTINQCSTSLTTINSEINNGMLLVPTGAVIWHAGDSPPDWFLLCDGSNYSTTQFPKLFTAIGYKYGRVGDNFCVPYMIDGRYVKGRGADTAGNYIYQNAFVSEVNNQGLPYINLESAGNHRHLMHNATGSESYNTYTAYDGTHGHTLKANQYRTTASEPKSIFLLPCIRV